MKANSNVIRWVHLALIVVVFIFSFRYIFNEKLDLNGDNAAYIELARNIAQGHGFTNETLDGAWHPHSHFPVGYPFILSLMVLCGLDNLIAFKVLNGLFLLGGAILFYFLLTRHTKNAHLAFVCALLTVMSPHVLKFATMAMSEMSFLFFMILTMWALSRSGEEKKSFGPFFVVAALGAAACYYLRAVGAAVLFANLVFYLFRREWKQAAVGTGISVVAILPWMIRNRLAGVSRDYLMPILAKNPWRPEEGNIASVGEFFKKIWTNLDETALSGYRHILFPNWQGYGNGPSSTMTLILGAVILLVVLYGLWNTGKMRFALEALFIANIGFLLLWNGGNGVRYVTPFIPFLFLGFWNGVYSLLRWLLWKKWDLDARQWVVYLVLLVLPAFHPMLAEMHQAASQPLPPAYANYYHIAEEVNKQSKPGHKYVVCCRKPELFKYYAPKTLTTTYARTKDSEKLVRGLLQNRVDFVVLEQLGYSSTPLYLYPAITTYPELFPVVWQLKNPDTYLLRFDREKAAAMLGE
ncbi:MAG: glycosyltransferase family 39 protein [Bacteroidales bacterium]|nr:glycosyltransferase family 39 protein [Bacteroidales bacterium]